MKYRIRVGTVDSPASWGYVETCERAKIVRDLMGCDVEVIDEHGVVVSTWYAMKARPIPRRDDRPGYLGLTRGTP